MNGSKLAYLNLYTFFPTALLLGIFITSEKCCAGIPDGILGDVKLFGVFHYV